MKKVAVITRHAITNYGSLLQAIATQKLICDCGYQCEVIDYIRKDEKYNSLIWTTLQKKPRWNRNFITRCVYLSIRQPEHILAWHKFRYMQQNYLRLTAEYNDFESLCESPPSADIYMTGSDQVWGIVANGEHDRSYFLDFIEGKSRKVAFSASFGNTEMTESNRKLITKWLSTYNDIAVREENAKKLLQSFGFYVRQVLDPTLMITKEEWEEYIKRGIGKDYVLVYQIHDNKSLSRYAKEFAKQVNLPLIRISSVLHQCVRGGRFCNLPDISEFLSYIKNARYVITDSFHGTAFSLNFNVQFIEILPDNQTAGRNTSILHLTGLSNRIITDFNDFSIKDDIIDYERVNEIMKREREQSKNILKEMLDSAGDAL